MWEADAGFGTAQPAGVLSQGWAPVLALESVLQSNCRKMQCVDEVCLHAQNVKHYNHSKATELNEDCLEEEAAMTDVGAPAPFIAIQPFPALLDLPMGSDAVKASCGSRHTAVVTREWTGSG